MHQRRRNKQRRRTTTTEVPYEKDVNILGDEELADEAGSSSSESQENATVLRMDPCMDKHCGAGRICKVSFLSLSLSIF